MPAETELLGGPVFWSGELELFCRENIRMQSFHGLSLLLIALPVSFVIPNVMWLRSSPLLAPQKSGKSRQTRLRRTEEEWSEIVKYKGVSCLCSLRKFGSVPS